eukprot:scaffold53836_cov34-Attheya_sp.AAC.2
MSSEVGCYPLCKNLSRLAMDSTIGFNFGTITCNPKPFVKCSTSPLGYVLSNSSFPIVRETEEL